MLAFNVSDTGIGIADDKQQLIFEAFQQADASTSRTYGGTGLGLTISRELAHLLGGEIRLRSTAGKGSTFTLYLPLTREERDSAAEPGREPELEPPDEEPQRAEAEAAAPAIFEPHEQAPEGPDSELVGRKVLLVDDDVRNLFAVTSLLERYRMKVLPAGSAREAMDVLRSVPDIDCVLMDIMMPETDGLQAAREIRAQDRFADLPIIALTAKAMRGDREKCLEAGCSDFVPKPVENDRLVRALKRSLRQN